MANTNALLQDSPLWIRASELPAKEQTSIHVPLPVSALRSLFNRDLERGCLTEISGRRSTGRTSICLHLLAQATRNGEICAVVDTTGSLHPDSAAGAGVQLDRLLWIRCNGNAEHSMRIADLLLHAGGFGIVWLDLCEVTLQVLNRIPISYWHRYRRALDDTSTIFLLTSEFTQAKSSLVNKLELSSSTLCLGKAARLGDWQSRKTRAGWRTSTVPSRTKTLSMEF